VLDLPLAAKEDLHASKADTDLGMVVDVEDARADRLITAAPAARDRRTSVVVT
jgi:hypothetical protein